VSATQPSLISARYGHLPASISSSTIFFVVFYYNLSSLVIVNRAKTTSDLYELTACFWQSPMRQLRLTEFVDYVPDESRAGSIQIDRALGIEVVRWWS
jgi:hypothetical protein